MRTVHRSHRPLLVSVRDGQRGASSTDGLGQMRRVTYMESLAEIEYRKLHGRPMARVTHYKGVAFRSRLEVRFAFHLDLLGERWKYEPRTYGPKGKRYIPDFEILGAVRPTFIEIKPTLAEVDAAKEKMSVIWDTHPDALLIVACEEARAFHGCYGGGQWTSWQERWAA